MASGELGALVIFGATGDLAKLETFPALVGLVARDVLDVPVVGVAKSGWGLEDFRSTPQNPCAATTSTSTAPRRLGCSGCSGTSTVT